MCVFRLRRYVKRVKRGANELADDPEHYTLLVHGSGANSGNWICVRYYYAVMGVADRVVMW